MKSGIMKMLDKDFGCWWELKEQIENCEKWDVYIVVLKFLKDLAIALTAENET